VTYGENETEEFKRQSEDYFRAMQEKGVSGECFELPVVNHFDIVMELNRPDSLLFRKLQALIRSE
jgi:arylformamidase